MYYKSGWAWYSYVPFADEELIPIASPGNRRVPATLLEAIPTRHSMRFYTFGKAGTLAAARGACGSFWAAVAASI